jgi:hypothetical protein
MDHAAQYQRFRRASELACIYGPNLSLVQRIFTAEPDMVVGSTEHTIRFVHVA